LSGYQDTEESVQVVAGQTVFITKALQSVPTTGSVSIQPKSSTLVIGQTQEFTIVLDAVPEGLAGYNITVTLDDCISAGSAPRPPIGASTDTSTTLAVSSVGEIVSVSYPTWANIPENSSLPADSVFVRAVDLTDSIESGATNVTLCTLTIRGDASGTANLAINTTKIDDDIGGRLIPTVTAATLKVQAALPFPNPAGGNFSAPTDTNGDGLYEDLDGTDFIGFNDVVVYYRNMNFIESKQPLTSFDYDGSGFIGFNDVVSLYRMV